MKKIIIILFVFSLFFSCNSLKRAFKINKKYSSERFDLILCDYLNDNGLFTLELTDSLNQNLGKCEVYLLFKKADKKTYQKFLYSLDLKSKNNSKLSAKHLIDDNYIKKNKNNDFIIFNQGKQFGYSKKEYVNFLPKRIKTGKYDFQAVIYIVKLKKTIYSNIIKIEIPFKTHKK